MIKKMSMAILFAVFLLAVPSLATDNPELERLKNWPVNDIGSMFTEDGGPEASSLPAQPLGQWLRTITSQEFQWVQSDCEELAGDSMPQGALCFNIQTPPGICPSASIVIQVQEHGKTLVHPLLGIASSVGWEGKHMTQEHLGRWATDFRKAQPLPPVIGKSDLASETAVAFAKTLDVHTLAPLLPSQSLEKWLLTLPGGTGTWTWIYADCSTGFGPTDYHFSGCANFPACVSIRSGSPGTKEYSSIWLIVEVGHFRTGLDSPPRVPFIHKKRYLGVRSFLISF